MKWKIRDNSISFDKPLLMGILNLTPDSFSDGGLYLDPGQAVRRGLEMVRDGVDFLDLGGESTKPGAEIVSSEEELSRVLPVLEGLKSQTHIPISIDTTKPGVARVCLERGAHIINDVSGLKDSGPEMAQIVRDAGAGIILMHRRGNSQTMQTLTQYGDVVREVSRELEESVRIALEAGITKDRIVLDPGIGFAKDAGQNFELIRRAGEFHQLGFPLLLGVSRKSFIGKVTGGEPLDRDFATAAIVAMTAAKGIEIHRAHNVKAMREVLLMAEAVNGRKKFEIMQHQF